MATPINTILDDGGTGDFVKYSAAKTAFFGATSADLPAEDEVVTMTIRSSGGGIANPDGYAHVTDFTVDAGGATAFNELADPFKAGDRVGWKLDLEDAGERCLNKPVIIGGAVLISTFTPDSDICAMSGDGKLYGLYFQTGTAHYKPIIGENETTGESIRSRDIGKGMPASLGIHVGKQTGGTGFVQSSTGAIIEQDIEPPLQFKSGGISWRQF